MNRKNISFACLLNKKSTFVFFLKVLYISLWSYSFKILILRILLFGIIFSLYRTQHQESSLKRILCKMSTAIIDDNASHNNSNIGNNYNYGGFTMYGEFFKPTSS